MPPSESQILTSYLLSPAPLPTILSLDQFRVLFPKQHRAHPLTKQLYRDLQFLRSVDMDVVSSNIEAEVLRGELQRLAMYKALHAGRRGLVGGDDDGVDGREIDMDAQLFGPVSNLPADHRALHTRESLLASMEQACADLERQTRNAEVQAEGVLEKVRETVGELSDLRYGKFARVSGQGEEGVAERVVEALDELRAVCEKAGGKGEK